MRSSPISLCPEQKHAPPQILRFKLLEKNSLPLNVEATASLPGHEETSQVLRQSAVLTRSKTCIPFVKNSRSIMVRACFSILHYLSFTTTTLVILAEHPSGRKSLSLQDLKEGLKPIPDEETLYEVPPHVTVVSNLSKRDIYVKRPRLTSYEDSVGTGLLPKLFLAEAETLELLERNPHANLGQYHGCSSDGAVSPVLYWIGILAHWRLR